MKPWFDKRKRDFYLERELRAARPEPPAALVRAIVARLMPRAANTSVRARFGFAVVLTGALFGVILATGGLSYAGGGGGGGGSSSCDQYAVAPTVSGASFTAPAVAGRTVVTVSGSHFSGINQISDVNIGGVDLTSGFTVSGSGTLTFTIPAAATSGNDTVELVNCAGNGSSDAFLVQKTPSNVSASPSSGATGLAIEIDGLDLYGVTGIKFGSVNVAVTAGQIAGNGHSISNVVVPKLPNNTYTLIATNAAGPSTVSNGTFQVVSPPTITSFSDTTSGATATSGIPTDTVHIVGANLSNPTAVKFGGGSANLATISGASDSAFDITVPAGATTGSITVSTAAGTATKSLFTIIQSPTISSGTASPAGLAPSFGSVGTTVTISGTGFSGGTTKVTFAGTGGAQSPLSVPTDTKLTVKVPVGTDDGAVTVSNHAGSSSASAQTFFIIGTPLITGADTAGHDGHVAIGGVAIISGSSFGGASSVTINGKPAAKFTVVTDSEIDATVAAGTAVGSSPGIVVKVGSLASAAFTGLPVVTGLTIASANAFSPAQVKATDSVVITGTNFNIGDDATHANVLFTGSASSVQGDVNLAGTTVTVNVPSDAQPGPVTVSNSVGSVTSSASLAVLIKPTVSSVTPSTTIAGTATAAAKSGGVLTILGHHFTGTTGISAGANGQTLNFACPGSTCTVTGDTSIKLTLSAVWTSALGHLGTLAINNADFSSDGYPLEIDATPTISNLNPTHEPVNSTHAIGAVVITGTNLGTSSSVTIGGKVPSSMTIDSPTQITATPALGTKTGAVVIKNAAGQTPSGTTFTVDGAPLISSVTVNGKTTGSAGDPVVIKGSNLDGVDTVAFNPGAHEVDVTSGHFSASASQITLNVPAGAQSGAVEVIDTASGSFTSKTTLVIYQAPAYSSFTPLSGKSGTKVTIYAALSPSGTFTGATEVDFGQDAHTHAWVGSAKPTVAKDGSSLTVVVPVGARTGKVRIVTPAGSADSGTDTFTDSTPAFDAAPFTPSQATVGTAITITGSGFTGVAANGVIFGKQASTNAAVANDNTIHVTVPAGATTGKVTVKNTSGTAASAGNFNVVVTPVVTSFTPTTVALGGAVTVTGKGFSGVDDGVGSDGITIGGQSVTAFVINSDTSATLTVPAGTTLGAAHIVMRNQAGASAPSTTTATVVVRPGAVVYHSGSPNSALHGATQSIVLDVPNVVAGATVKFSKGSVDSTVTKTTVSTTAHTVIVATPKTLDVGAWTVTVFDAGITATGSVTFTVTAPGSVTYHAGSLTGGTHGTSKSIVLDVPNVVAGATVRFTNGGVTLTVTRTTVNTRTHTVSLATPKGLTAGTWTITVFDTGVTASGSVSFTVS